MANYNYQAKVLEFSSGIQEFLQQKLQEQEFENLLVLVHKMLFYAEQYFIENQINGDSEKSKIITQQCVSVIKRLKNFANAVVNFDNELKQMAEFLSQWKKYLA